MKSLMQRVTESGIPPEDWSEWMDLMVEVEKIGREKRIVRMEVEDIENERLYKQRRNAAVS